MDPPDSHLSERSANVLRLIAEGRSYDQILLRYPELTYQDIFAAAHEALSKLQARQPGGSVSQVPVPPGPREPAVAPRPDTESTETPATAPRVPTFIERARATHHRAWARWTADEDVQLERLFRRGAHLAEIGQALGRHNGAIRSRLAKLGLISESDEDEISELPPVQPLRHETSTDDSRPAPRSATSWEQIRRWLDAAPHEGS